MRGMAMLLAAACAAGCGHAAKRSEGLTRDPHAGPHADPRGGRYAGADGRYGAHDTAEDVPAAEKICGEVHIAPELSAKMRPHSVLFVFAKPQLGSGPPAAVVREEAPRFPVTFCLSQKNSMAGVPFVGAQYVTARVEFDTSAGAVPGDLETVTREPVSVGTSHLVLTIDTVRS